MSGAAYVPPRVPMLLMVMVPPAERIWVAAPLRPCRSDSDAEHPSSVACRPAWGIASQFSGRGASYIDMADDPKTSFTMTVQPWSLQVACPWRPATHTNILLLTGQHAS